MSGFGASSLDKALLASITSQLEDKESRQERARFIAGLALTVGGHLDITLPSLELFERWGTPLHVEVPKSGACPELLGALYETLLDQGSRRRSGAFYTPRDVASTVVGWALADMEKAVVCDPAVGGGAFLLAAADRLLLNGLERRHIVESCLIGADLDPIAAAVTEASLSLWCGGKALPKILVSDALSLDVQDWPQRIDVIVGNPPFLSQLSSTTSRTREEAEALALRFGRGLGAYVDTASLFWVMSSLLVAPGGRVALVLPQSTLAVRDSDAARQAVLEEMIVEVLWIPGKKLFGASVEVCVAVMKKVSEESASLRTYPLRTYTGVPPLFKHATNIAINELRDSPNWSHLVADALGVPSFDFSHNKETLGDRWQVVADFRDEYYGVVPFLIDDPHDELDDQLYPKLVTVGLIDPACCRWGIHPARFARQRWLAPRVDLAALESTSSFGPWARQRLAPKVVLATQTSVLEAAVDETGAWLAMTPAISIIADPDDLWHVAALLLSPPVSVWSLRVAAGAALMRSGIKLRASQVREIPLPTHQSAWDTAAELVRDASQTPDQTIKRELLLQAALASCRAYGQGPNQQGTELVNWWSSRLPPLR